MPWQLLPQLHSAFWRAQQHCLSWHSSQRSGFSCLSFDQDPLTLVAAHLGMCMGKLERVGVVFAVWGMLSGECWGNVGCLCGKSCVPIPHILYATQSNISTGSGKSFWGCRCFLWWLHSSSPGRVWFLSGGIVSMFVLRYTQCTNIQQCVQQHLAPAHTLTISHTQYWHGVVLCTGYQSGGSWYPWCHACA